MCSCVLWRKCSKDFVAQCVPLGTINPEMLTGNISGYEITISGCDMAFLLTKGEDGYNPLGLVVLFCSSFVLPLSRA